MNIRLKWVSEYFVRYISQEIREETKLYLFCGNIAHPNGTINVKLKVNKQNQLHLYCIKQQTFRNFLKIKYGFSRYEVLQPAFKKIQL